LKKEIYLIKPLLNKLEKFQPTPTLAYFLITLATFLWALSIVTIRGVHEENCHLCDGFWALYFYCLSCGENYFVSTGSLNGTLVGFA